MEKVEELIRGEISPDNLRKIYEYLHSIISSGLVQTYESECISLIETIIEYLIYGDQSDSFIFDIFCEFNFMLEFVQLSSISNKVINLQIIKSFSLLITNISNKQTIYYIFSNNFINQIISTNDNRLDNDFLSYYVNFLKSLSLKMDRLTIQLFFFKQKNEFPLLDSALRLYNHSDPMIINVVRNIFLTILKTKYVPVLDYICSLPCISYFNLISCRVRDSIKHINEKLTTDNLDSIKYAYDEVINDVLFFQDIFSLKIGKINYILTNCLFHYVILPLLCSSLLHLKEKKISIYVGLNMLIVFAFYIEDEAFLNCLFIVLFNEQLHYSFKQKIMEDPANLPEYYYKMEDKEDMKMKEKTFAQFVTSNFCENFIKSIQYMAKSQYRPITEIVAKLNKLFDNQSSGINQNSGDLYKIILVELYSALKPEDINEMNEYHHILSLSTGISCGLTFRDEKNSVVQRLNHLFKYLNGDHKPHNKRRKLISNEIRQNILSYFKSKSDSLILLSGLLIHVFIKKASISKELLSLNKLLPSNDFKVYSEEQQDNCIDDDSIKLSDIIIGDKQETKKREKYSDITLLNYYSFSSYPKKYDIITLDSIYFQEKLQIIQSSYSKEIVDNILSLFNSDISYRSLTSRVIIEIAELLIVPKNHINSEDPNLRRIHKGYITAIMDVNRFLQHDAIIISQCYYLFEEEWKRFNSNVISILDSLICEPYMLYPSQYEETLHNFPPLLKTARTSTEKFSSFLNLFMSLNDFRVKVSKKGIIIKESFPLKLKESEAELNERISLKKVSAIFNSKIKKGSQCSLFINYSMFIFKNYLIFTTPDIQNPSFSIVKQRYPIRQLEIQGDRSEPRNLIVYSREGKNYVEIIISLEDVKTASKVKSLLEEQRRSIEKAEYIMVESYFDDKLKSFEQ